VHILNNALIAIGMAALSMSLKNRPTVVISQLVFLWENDLNLPCMWHQKYSFLEIFGINIADKFIVFIRCCA